MNKPKWRMPAWMFPYTPLFVNTGREPTVEAIEEMVNDDADPLINLPLSVLQACVKTQVGFLGRLRAQGMLKE